MYNDFDDFEFQWYEPEPKRKQIIGSQRILKKTYTSSWGFSHYCEDGPVVTEHIKYDDKDALWMMKNGDSIWISCMEDKHLLNSARYARRRCEAAGVKPKDGCKVWKNLVYEIKRRKLVL